MALADSPAYLADALQSAAVELLAGLAQQAQRAWQAQHARQESQADLATGSAAAAGAASGPGGGGGGGSRGAHPASWVLDVKAWPERFLATFAALLVAPNLLLRCVVLWWQHGMHFMLPWAAGFSAPVPYPDATRLQEAQCDVPALERSAAAPFYLLLLYCSSALHDGSEAVTRVRRSRLNASHSLCSPGSSTACHQDRCRGAGPSSDTPVHPGNCHLCSL